jgi:hypothetical protein
LKPVALWPNYAGESKQVCFVVKTVDGLESMPFPLENPGRFVLIMKPPPPPPATTSTTNATSNQRFSSSMASNINNQSDQRQPVVRILTVLISGGSTLPVTIIIRKYQYGDSVAKFVNLCDSMNIQLRQKSMDGSWKLEPMKSMFFTWPELVKSVRELQWTVNFSNDYLPLKLTSSGIDSYKLNILNETSMRSSSENEPLEGSGNFKLFL